MTDKKRFELACPRCGQVTTYDQPYPYHAGFSDRFFLYNDEGTLTLVWSSWDSTFEPANGLTWLSPANEALRKGIEDVLPAAPKGGRWHFGNPSEGIAYLDLLYLKKRGQGDWDSARIFYSPGGWKTVPKDDVFGYLQYNRTSEITAETPWPHFPGKPLVQ